MLDFKNFEVITFDCYGTLIDWEFGLWNALRPVLLEHGVSVGRELALELYGELEFEIESGQYSEYQTVLQKSFAGVCTKLGFVPTKTQLPSLAESLKHWPAFPDSVLALQALKEKFKLAIISNVDDDLFDLSAQHLHVDFDWVFTAQQVRSYKPSLSNFQFALQRIGLPRFKILHVAQSQFHDIVPAKSLGLCAVWINRRHDKRGFGATRPANAEPDLEVPDLETLVTMIDSM